METGGGFALLASLFSDPLAAAGLWRTTVGTNVPQSTLLGQSDYEGVR